MVESYTAEVIVPDLLEAPGYGLLDNVTWIPGDPAGHWQGGIQYDAYCYASSPTISACFDGGPTEIADKAATWEHMTRGSRPFTVFDQWDCPPVGRGLTAAVLDDARDRAIRALAASAAFSVERVFWSGDVGNSPAKVYPNLIDINDTPIVTGTNGLITLQPSGTNVTGIVDVVEALGTLESLVAECYHGRAWIHVPSILLPALVAQNLCYERGGKLYTYAGNLVIVGRGYDITQAPDEITHPAPQVPGAHAHMIATSPVFGIKSTPRSFGPVESFDRSVNTMKMIAEQTYILGWHCCLISVGVTLGGEAAGSVGDAAAQT